MPLEIVPPGLDAAHRGHRQVAERDRAGRGVVRVLAAIRVAPGRALDVGRREDRGRLAAGDRWPAVDGDDPPGRAAERRRMRFPDQVRLAASGEKQGEDDDEDGWQAISSAARRRSPAQVPGRRTTDAGPPAWARSIASLASASAAEFWARGAWTADHRSNDRSVDRAASQSGMSLRVLDPPATGELLDDQLRIEDQRDFPGPELARQVEGPNDARVLGDVVRLDPEIVRDRGVGRCPRVPGIRARGVDENRPGRRRSRVAAGRPVGPDDQAQRVAIRRRGA